MLQDLEPAFMHMISDILDDRWNEKSEGLFRKFFAFCVQNMSSS